MKRKIAIVLRGCPKNEVDAQVLAGELKTIHFNIVSNVEEADIIIIFSCAFIKSAVEETLETIFEISLLKKEILVVGCIVNRYGKEKLKKIIPEVKEFFGTYDFLKVVDYIKNNSFSLSKNQFIYSSNNNRILEQNFAYVKISEGCSNSCSFCTIPFIKGKLFSRKLEDIINEIKFLTEEKGIKEIILISQNNGEYGKDLKNNTNITKLIKEILKINALTWLRVLYIYPYYINDEFLELTLDEKFCNYLDMPVQHIDNDILKAMGRKSNEKLIRNILYKIKTFYPHLFLRTSIIVGFPGETEEKFLKLLDFIKEYQFYNLGCFKYSPEENTKAAKFQNQIPDSLKSKRYRVIMKEQKRIVRSINKNLINKTFKILLSGYSDETDLLLIGRTEFQAPDIDGITYINKGNVEYKDFYNIKITGFKDYDLIGEIV